MIFFSRGRGDRSTGVQIWQQSLPNGKKAPVGKRGDRDERYPLRLLLILRTGTGDSGRWWRGAGETRTCSNRVNTDDPDRTVNIFQSQKKSGPLFQSPMRAGRSEQPNRGGRKETKAVGSHWEREPARWDGNRLHWWFVSPRAEGGAAEGQNILLYNKLGSL